MINFIKKLSNVSFEVTSSYTPASPGYSSVRTEQYTVVMSGSEYEQAVAGQGYSGVQLSGVVYNNPYAGASTDSLDASIPIGSTNYYGFSQYNNAYALVDQANNNNSTYTVTYEYTVYEDPTPAVSLSYGQFVTEAAIGWDAGAESLEKFDGPVILSFEPTENTSGAVIGISEAVNVGGYGYKTIEFGFYISNGGYTVIESGVYKTSAIPFDEGDVMAIRVSGGEIRYYRNETLVYISEALAPAPSTILAADVSLYASGDRINNAAFERIYELGAESSAAPRSSTYNVRYFTAEGSASPKSYAAPTGMMVASSYASPEAQVTSSLGLAISTASSGLPEAVANFYVDDGQYVESELEALQSLSYDAPYSIVSSEMAPLTSESEEALIAPAYALAETSLAFLIADGVGLTGQITVSSDMNTEALQTLSSDHEYGSSTTSMSALASRSFGPVEYEGMIATMGQSTIEAFGHPSDLSGALVTAPAMTLNGYGGGVAALTTPGLTIEVDSTLHVVGRLTKTASKMSLNAQGTTGAVGRMTANTSARTLEGYGGGEARVSVARATLGAEGTVGTVGNMQGEVPRLTLTATSQAIATGRAELTAPRMVMNTAIARLEIPRATLDGSFVLATTAIKQIFCVNKSLGEATEYDNNMDMAFMGMLGGMPIAIGSAGVNRVEGTKDNGEDIDAYAEFSASDFGSNNKKRMYGLYVSGEGDAELGVTVRTLDGMGGDYYSDNNYHKELGTRRCKVGKGVVGQYWGIKVESVGGTPFAIDGVEYIVGVLERRR